ncbi:hypothetical protein CYMTET_52448 [Cymbomonas tetramitiformis]|uniref:Uncharacterized protein n=1 Tax=Cymbomonas tetramitiformis TaxID=36881 RepID=A0AAE0BK51_9CHLO|nr:hypothetical protein CYMTET_52448 [Cymbomonas tetramitiformis]
MLKRKIGELGEPSERFEEVTPQESEAKGAPGQQPKQSTPNENGDTLTDVTTHKAKKGDAIYGNMHYVQGFSNRLAVNDVEILEQYVSYRLGQCTQSLPRLISNTVKSFLKKQCADGFPGTDAFTDKRNDSAPALTPERARQGNLRDGSDTDEANEATTADEKPSKECRHSCGTGHKTVQPPPVIPYASAYWLGKRGPPGADNAGKKLSIGHHVRTKCGEIPYVHLINPDTDEHVKIIPKGLTFRASLLGPYRESEHGGHTDVTFAKENWTEEQYEKEKVTRLKCPLSETRLMEDPAMPGYFCFQEGMTFQTSNAKGEFFRLGVQAVAEGSASPLQPSGFPWVAVMTKSAPFEVHNTRSLNDRAPDILPQLSSGSEPSDVKLLKGVGRTAAENLRKTNIQNVKQLLAASQRDELRAQLKQILRKDLDCVLEHARTAVPLPLRVWTRADGYGITCIPEHTDRFGFLHVNYPYQLVTPKITYSINKDMATNGFPSIPFQLEPLCQELKEAAMVDWLKDRHPNWALASNAVGIGPSPGELDLVRRCSSLPAKSDDTPKPPMQPDQIKMSTELLALAKAGIPIGSQLGSQLSSQHAQLLQQMQHLPTGMLLKDPRLLQPMVHRQEMAMSAAPMVPQGLTLSLFPPPLSESGVVNKDGEVGTNSAFSRFPKEAAQHVQQRALSGQVNIPDEFQLRRSLSAPHPQTQTGFFGLSLNPDQRGQAEKDGVNITLDLLSPDGNVRG